jgi:hypothetical protein
MAAFPAIQPTEVYAMKLALLTTALLLSAPLLAQPPTQHPHVLSGSHVFIEPMDGFEVYLSAAIIEKRVPVTVVDSREKADYVISGNSHLDKASWAKMLILKSGATGASASIIVKDAKTGDMVYAYAVDKFNSVRQSQSTAEACAKHLKGDIEKGTKW